MAVQVRNNELVDLLRADFQARSEPNFAWKSAVSSLLALPGIRGVWPMSSFDSAGNAYDMSGQARTLTYNGNPLYNYSNLAPYIQFDGTGDRLTRADEAGLDITGTESYVAPVANGLTMLGWFYVTAFDVAANDGLFSKWITAGNLRSYLLYIPTPASQIATFVISTDGIATVAVSTTTISIGRWYFIASRFVPSTSLDIWLNGTKTTNAVGIPASIFNSTSLLEIGSMQNGANPFNGRASMCALCATALSDAIIGTLYQQMRTMYGV